MTIWVIGIGRNSSGWVCSFFPSIHRELNLCIGASIFQKVKEAVPECNEHQADFKELTQSLEHKYPEQLALWKQQVEEWESDPSNPNPFEVKNDGVYEFNKIVLSFSLCRTLTGITQASVRLQLAKDEATICLDESKEPPLHSDITPSILISTGIDLEEQQ